MSIVDMDCSSEEMYLPMHGSRLCMKERASRASQQIDRAAIVSHHNPVYSSNQQHRATYVLSAVDCAKITLTSPKRSDNWRVKHEARLQRAGHRAELRQGAFGLITGVDTRVAAGGSHCVLHRGPQPPIPRPALGLLKHCAYGRCQWAPVPIQPPFIFPHFLSAPKTLSAHPQLVLDGGTARPDLGTQKVSGMPTLA